MLPLIKKGMDVSYRMGKNSYEGKVYQARIDQIWVHGPHGKILRLHKKFHQVKILEEPKEKPKEGNTKNILDKLLS